MTTPGRPGEPTPARGPFLSAQWRYLVMLNYEVPPELLLPMVPSGTTLDLWHGRALVSVVGFRFVGTRVLGLPLPWHRNFDEVNLRFYVRRDTADGSERRGVTFIRELVPRAAIATVARLAYNEPYLAVPMRSTAPDDWTATPGLVRYEWRTSGRWQQVAATAVGAPALAAEGSEAQFITEHYWGYTRQRDGTTLEYQVTHPAWRVWRAESPTLDANATELYGAEFAESLTGPPVSAFVAEGSEVVVCRPVRLGG